MHSAEQVSEALETIRADVPDRTDTLKEWAVWLGDRLAYELDERAVSPQIDVPEVEIPGEEIAERLDEIARIYAEPTTLDVRSLGMWVDALAGAL